LILNKTKITRKYTKFFPLAKFKVPSCKLLCIKNYKVVSFIIMFH